MTTYYKVLAEDGSAHHGGRGKWPLPHGKRPGKWLHVDGEIIPCEHGLHLCRRQDLIHWLGPTIYTAEVRGNIIDADNKIVVADARLLAPLDTWNETTARLFAADCASYAVRQCRKNGINIDKRVIESIKVVYRYARGEATEDERSAAWSAARSAARSAAALAAGLAAESAAWSAAWSAAESAAGSAAALAARWLAAGLAAESWQAKRLFEYLDGKRS